MICVDTRYAYPDLYWGSVTYFVIDPLYSSLLFCSGIEFKNSLGSCSLLPTTQGSIERHWALDCNRHLRILYVDVWFEHIIFKGYASRNTLCLTARNLTACYYEKNQWKIKIWTIIGKFIPLFLVCISFVIFWNAGKLCACSLEGAPYNQLLYRQQITWQEFRSWLFRQLLEAQVQLLLFCLSKWMANKKIQYYQSIIIGIIKRSFEK